MRAHRVTVLSTRSLGGRIAAGCIAMLAALLAVVLFVVTVCAALLLGAASAFRLLRPRRGAAAAGEEGRVVTVEYSVEEPEGPAREDALPPGR